MQFSEKVKNEFKIKDGKVWAFRLPGGHYRVDKEDSRDFLERWDIPIKERLFDLDRKAREDIKADFL